MSGIAIYVRGISAPPNEPLTIDFLFVTAASGTLTGDVGVPFNAPPEGVNASIIASAKVLAERHGFPVNDGDAVLLFGGITSASGAGAPPQLAHVVMKGSTVDSVFVGAEAEDDARVRADALAEATEGLAQDDARKAAPWLAAAPVNPE